MLLLLRNIFLLVASLCISCSLSAQTDSDSLAIAYAAQKDMLELQEEQKELNFTKFFFEALQQKAIGNFEKAISALEKCQSIKSDDEAVNFELGKNYFELEKYIEAESYTKRALEKDPDNLYILMLLKHIYNSQNNFKEALIIQKKIATQKPDHQLDLVILYIKNNQIDNARALLQDLEKEGKLTPNLIPFKESLLKGKVLTPVTTATEKPVEELTIDELKHKYAVDNSFSTLKQLLLRLHEKKRILDLEKESALAIELFPAQPLVYLMNGTALNQKKQYEKALSVLQNGLDYLVDDVSVEADFYEQISLSYKGLGQNVNASKYANKANALREKKS